MNPTDFSRREDVLARAGSLLILRGAAPGHPTEEPAAASPDPGHADAEIFIAVTDDGRITAFNGHVDLGTGIRTALAQIVAEELDVSVAQVTMVLGDTAIVPNQGATIASETIQVTAVPLRAAAATARRFLVARAAERLGVPLGDLRVEDGIVSAAGSNRSASYADLVRDRLFRVELDETAPIKPVAQHRIVGQPVARVDIPAKVTGAFRYVHDQDVPGMLHGRVVRPPYGGRDAGTFVGHSLVAVDESSVAGLPGVVAVVVIRDFVGVVAEREEQAIAAAERLAVTWREPPPLPDLNAPEQALRAKPSSPRRLLDRGDVDAALAGAATPLGRTYTWPFQMHASIGPSCSVADWRADGLTLWSGTQNPHMLRTDVSRLTGLAEERIDIVRLEAAGCYGRNCADDVGADAVLLSRAVGRPVRVQLTREQEHGWEPKGAAQVMDVAGGLDAEGGVAGYDYESRYPSNGAPTLALLLTGIVEPIPAVFEMGDRTAIPPYVYANARVTVHDMPPIARAAWLRGVSALPNTFAHESWIDECATQAGVDPVEYRLRYLHEPRAVELVEATAKRAGWVPHTAPQTLGRDGDTLFGRGFAYALYVHSKFPGFGAAWSAWVADVAVNRRTGEVALTRVTVGQDSGMMVNPAGIRHQIHGNVVQATSRVLNEEVQFERTAVVSREWGSYPILTFPDVPQIDVLTMPRQHEPPLGGGESASVPSAAAIANAIFDATGVRFREVPFTPERVRAALNPGEVQPAKIMAPAPPPAKSAWKAPRWLGLVGAAAAGAIGTAAALLPLRSAIPPIARPDAAMYSAATLARGKLVAAIGNCTGCHTAPDGALLAGGLALDTPFGRIWSTNITPDPTHGIGAWSYPAFARAMREGVSRDGHQLYPAHPYPSFAKTDETDLQALYAYVMAQPASATTPPATALRFPFNIRPLLAAWNALFLRTAPFTPDPTRSELWNRGAYLVEGLGHCGACHTPRNRLGAEKTGAAHLAGAVQEGWEAPALTALSHAPIPWSEDELAAYLRTGQSRFHGVAAGPMAPVVRELAALPDQDIRAMAVYLASLSGPAPADPQAAADALHARTAPESVLPDAGSRLFAGACAVCHEVGRGPPLFGARPSLALNTSVHSDRPDNLIRVVLEGIAEPAHPDLGAMPGFGGHLSNAQIADLLRHIRTRFAPDRPAWIGLEETIGRMRSHQAAVIPGP